MVIHVLLFQFVIRRANGAHLRPLALQAAPLEQLNLTRGIKYRSVARARSGTERIIEGQCQHHQREVAWNGHREVMRA
jgi:hypothetical protein